MSEKASPTGQATKGEGTGMKKELTLLNFFTIGFGAIIGTGWVLLVGDWMVLGGGPLPAMGFHRCRGAVWSHRGGRRP